MPDTGAPWSIAYPASTEHARLYDHLQSTAESVAAALSDALPASDSEIQLAVGDTTSTSFVDAIGVEAANLVYATVTVPTSGAFMIILTAGIVNDNAAGETMAGWRLGTGATADAGTELVAAHKDRSLINTGLMYRRSSYIYVVRSQTPGDVLNVALRYAVSAGTGFYERRELTLVPCT
jgi:hypothetical protein